MTSPLWRRFGFVWMAGVAIVAVTAPVHGDEIWVAPTAQADIGGLGVASNAIWPATPIGVVRLAWSIPDNLQALQGAKVAIIPASPAGGPTALHFYVCAAQNGNNVAGDCTGPFAQTFTSVAEEVAEVFPELAVRDAHGNVETVHYETLNVLLLNELKNEHDKVEQQRQRIDVLEQRLNALLIRERRDRR